MTAVLALPSKIAKIVPVLGSDKSGEVIAAAGAIGRKLREAGRDWHDIARALERGWSVPGTVAPSPSIHGYPKTPESHVDLARWILGNDGGQLNRRERDFVADIIADAAVGIEATDRQMRWLRAIHASLKRRAR